MARPIKTGLDYFPHDCDASSDEKIEALRAIHGNDGYAFFFIACERIYRSNNLELIISDAETKQIFAKKVSVTPQKLEEMIQTALKFNCFDRDAYEKRGVLTSCGIKKRAQTVLEKREKMRSIYQNRVSDAETKEETREETSQETPQSKEKKRKEKNKAFLPLSELLRTKIQEQGTDGLFKQSDLDNWSKDFRLMVEQDKRTPDQIREKIEAVFKDDFWKKQIRSASTFREKWNSGKLDNLKANKPEQKIESLPQYLTTRL